MRILILIVATFFLIACDISPIETNKETNEQKVSEEKNDFEKKLEDVVIFSHNLDNLNTLIGIGTDSIERLIIKTENFNMYK